MAHFLHYIRVIFLAILSVLTILSCGSSINDAQEFTPNEAPVIIPLSAVNVDGSAFDPSSLVSGQVLRLSCTVYDPEGGKVICSVTSEYGSIRNQEYAQGTLSFLFYTRNLSADKDVDIAISASDDKNATTMVLYAPGTGKPIPTISLSVYGKESITSAEDTQVKLTSTGSGYYQFFCDNSISSIYSMRPGLQFPLEPNSEGKIDPVFFKVAGIKSDSSDCDARILTKGSNTLWVSFRDPNGKILYAKCVIASGGISATATYSSSSEIEGTSVNATITAIYNTSMDTESLQSASAVLGTTEGLVSSRTVDDTHLVLSITGLTTGSEYSVTLSGVKDSDGNTISPYTYSFTTLSQVSNIVLSDTDIVLRSGSTHQLTPTIYPENSINKNVKWESSNRSVITVDANGIVTAVKMGTASIVAVTNDGGKSASCTVEVEGKIVYDANGANVGTAPTDSGSYDPLEPVTVLGLTESLVKIRPDGEDTSYGFRGWNTSADGNGTDCAIGSTLSMPDDDIILYAKWAPYVVGDTGPAGGYIFFDNGSYVTTGGYSWRYLECAPRDINETDAPGTYSWLDRYCWTSNTSIQIITTAGIGYGRSNTNLIISSSGTAKTAAKNCNDFSINGYDDWFLPSCDELEIVRTLYIQIGGFNTTPDEVNNTYWSSEQSSTTSYAKFKMFPVATRGETWESDRACRIRAIREF